MSDRNPGPPPELSDAVSAPREVPEKRWRASLGARAAAATVIAGGLAAGGYGIASAATGPGGGPHSASPARDGGQSRQVHAQPPRPR